MSYSKLQKIYLPCDVGASGELIDLSAAATEVTWVPAEDMVIYGWGMHFLEAAAQTGFNTTVPVVQLKYDAADAGSPTTKGTWTLTAATAYAIGKEVADVDMVPFKTDASAGDAIEFVVGTAGSGQTVTGECRPFVYAEVFPAIAPA